MWNQKRNIAQPAPPQQALLKQIAGPFTSCTLSSVWVRADGVDEEESTLLKLREKGGGVS